MLILTRRVGESVMVGDKVTVTVLGVTGEQVRVGVDAPKEIPVHRDEIYARIRSATAGLPSPAHKTDQKRLCNRVKLIRGI